MVAHAAKVGGFNGFNLHLWAAKRAPQEELCTAYTVVAFFAVCGVNKN